MISRSNLTFAAIGLAIIFALVTSTFFIVNQAEEALVLRFGGVRQMITTPGLHMKVPFIDDVVRYDARLLDVDPPPEEVILGDQKRIVVDTYTRFRIVDPLRFYQAVRSEDGVRPRLQEVVNNALRRVLGNVDLPTVLSAKREDIMRQIQQDVSQAAGSLGVQVIDVRIRRADLPAQTSQAIYSRMKSERQREAAQARGEGQGEGPGNQGRRRPRPHRDPGRGTAPGPDIARRGRRRGQPDLYPGSLAGSCLLWLLPFVAGLPASYELGRHHLCADATVGFLQIFRPGAESGGLGQVRQISRGGEEPALRPVHDKRAVIKTPESETMAA